MNRVVWNPSRESFDFRPRLSPSLQVKEIGGRWVKSPGFWRLPPTMASLERLKKLFPDLVMDDVCQTRFQTSTGFELIDRSEIQNRLEQLNLSLLPWQIDAVQFMLSSPHRGGILALAPGLGKTLTSIAAAKLSGAKRVLVIAPLRLLPTWQAQIYKWLQEKAEIRHGQGPGDSNWELTNYETFVKFRLEYQRRQPHDWVIIDESIKIKNQHTQRAEAVKAGVSRIPHRWLLSGSPISRFADDLYSQFQIATPNLFTSYWRFARTYCIVDTTPWGDNVSGTRFEIEHRHEFRDLMFVRSHQDVYALKEGETSDLVMPPEPIYEHILAPMTDRQGQIYNKILEEFLLELSATEVSTITSRMAQITRLQQCVSTPRNFGDEWPSDSGKFLTLMELIQNDEVPLPTIIWVHWKASVPIIADALRKKGRTVEIATGDSKDPDQAIQRFVNGGVDVLILSLGVGKYGLTLTNAKSMIFYDKTFDADAYIQALARIVGRIGLSHVPLIMTLVSPGTVDALVERNLVSKSFSITQISNGDLLGLIRSLNHEHLMP